MKLFFGIDWAEAHHDVAIVDENGQLVAKKRIADDPTGLAQLVELFAEHGDSATDPIPVAVETPRGLLVSSLRVTGRTVYSINPRASTTAADENSATGTPPRSATSSTASWASSTTVYRNQGLPPAPFSSVERRRLAASASG